MFNVWLSALRAPPNRFALMALRAPPHEIVTGYVATHHTHTWDTVTVSGRVRRSDEEDDRERRDAPGGNRADCEKLVGRETGALGAAGSDPRGTANTGTGCPRRGKRR